MKGGKLSLWYFALMLGVLLAGGGIGLIVYGSTHPVRDPKTERSKSNMHFVGPGIGALVCGVILVLA